jgi:hypothetical protein
MTAVKDTAEMYGRLWPRAMWRAPRIAVRAMDLMPKL